jgi:hypothetical protein
MDRSSAFSGGEDMTEFRAPSPRFDERPSQDQRTPDLLRRFAIEIEDSIAQSRAVILSTKDAIELLEQLQGRKFSN